MSKRKDAQPRTARGASAQADKARPAENKAEMPGKRRAAKAKDEAIDKSTRRGER